MGRVNQSYQRGSFSEEKIRVINIILNLGRILGLLIILILATSHESANPKLGNSSIDFYFNDTQQQLKNELQQVTGESIGGQSIDSLLISITKSFYEARNYQPAWTFNFVSSVSFQKVDSLFINAYSFGLLPETYQTIAMKELFSQMANEDQVAKKTIARAKFEVLATKSVLLFALHVNSGIIHNAAEVTNVGTILSLTELLNFAISDNVVNQVLVNLQPQSIQYKLLQRSLAQFVKAHSINDIDVELTADSDSLQIFTRLQYLGFVADTANYSHKLLVSSLKGFKHRHGLDSNASLTRYTLRHLNTSNKYRFYQAALNLDRLRKISMTDGPYLFVNIPEYKLRYIDNNAILREHVVVVGKPSSPTPELESEIVKIIANPYWTVPRSISYNEILPNIRKDSTYLARNGYEVIDNFLNALDHSSINWQDISYNQFKTFWIRQKHGSANALGSVKFHFPNKYSVYLHDTPSRSKFLKDIRAYSHGCVRVDNPAELADFVLKQFVTSEKINFNDYIKSRVHKEFKLDIQLPVYLKYLTTTGNANGNIYFFTDIYSKDDQAMTELFPGWAS